MARISIAEQIPVVNEKDKLDNVIKRREILIHIGTPRVFEILTQNKLDNDFGSS